MPTIYSSIYANFFRQGTYLAKTLTTNGYAQSVVAATQSHVLNSPNRPAFSRQNPSSNTRFSRLNSLRFHTSLAVHSATAALVGLADRLGSAAGANAAGANAANVATATAAVAATCPPTHRHGGLDAYFEALCAREAAGDSAKEWSQFQFPKRIEWKPTPDAVLLRSNDSTHTSANLASSSSNQSLADGQQATATASEHLDAADPTKSSGCSVPISESSKDSEVAALDGDITFGSRVAFRNIERPASAPGLAPSAFAQPKRDPSPTVDPQSLAYAQHLTRLAQAGRYAEIPAVFEAMVATGVRPTVVAYNARLAAAIREPGPRIEIASKALDVYMKMTAHHIIPDSDTFDLLVGTLASRSLEGATLKDGLERQRRRFGGMDEPGRFMFASHQLDYAILTEDNRLGLAMQMFDTSVESGRAAYSLDTYVALITACARAGLITDMLRLFEHLEAQPANLYPAELFPAMITAYARAGDLNAAVECYKGYHDLAVATDNAASATTEPSAQSPRLRNRRDADVYAAVIAAYVRMNQPDRAVKFYEKVVTQIPSSGDSESNNLAQPEVGVTQGPITTATSTSPAKFLDAIVSAGFVDTLLDRGLFGEALNWALTLRGSDARHHATARVAATAADWGDMAVSNTAFAGLNVTPRPGAALADAIIALLALSVRRGDVPAASGYWDMLCSPASPVNASFIEPTAMYAVALVRSGLVAEGMTASDAMYQRILASCPQGEQEGLADQIDEAVEYVSRYVTAHGPVTTISPSASSTAVATAVATAAGQADYPLVLLPSLPSGAVATPVTPRPSTPATVLSHDDSYDPYAANTDFRGSTLIADELEGTGARHAPRLRDAMNRFRNMRRAGRHPRYVTYAKLIAAASRENRIELCYEILAMARHDVPLQPQYAVVRYGWTAILDAMVSACLTAGDRAGAERLHSEMLDFGSAPSANTFGLYITKLKDSTQTCDEASEAVRIFLRAKAEGVEPTSFLYNALIGKLGKARRIDDCLTYFTEMQSLGIRPTSVTYGTIVNALCRVSDDRFAEQLFDDMEAAPNYKARPAPYNSMMQFFLTTKRDKAKVLTYYARMRSRKIAPTSHTYKLLIDTHATLEPVDMAAAERVLEVMRAEGRYPESVHYASLIHARGCALHDLEGARCMFDSVLADPSVDLSPVVFQALLEAMVASHRVADSQPILDDMVLRGIPMTAYIANTLIHGWAAEGNLGRARFVFDSVARDAREPSTYEAMTRAYLGAEDHQGARGVVNEMMSRGYPSAVSGKVLELLGGGS